ncbi:MAG: NUDIX domain-containing protein [Myxococcota bacterium]
MKKKQTQRRPQRPRRTGSSPPDILYHATTRNRAGRASDSGVLEVAGGRPVYLSRSEAQAWQVAHRQNDRPQVLYIDVARARRDGCRFERNRHGLWQCRSVPTRHILNLRQGFAEQISAGGIPICMLNGSPKLALIRVRRSHSATWEIAKGKLEPGESPHVAAMREVQEEMGYPLDLRIRCDLGAVRFGFYTPQGEPRLKTLYLYLMDTPELVDAFEPSRREGIVEVSWFSVQDANRAVTHRSLKPLMRKVRRILEEPGFENPPYDARL